MISIGTDFSGIGSPEQALIKLGVEHESKFACDYDKFAKQSYLANYKPDIFYDDITKRNHKQTPYVDLYVAGFPCQAFSMAGKREGFDDTRGTLFFDLLQYLNEQKPKYFILENVVGLLSHDRGRTFQTILDCLAKTVNKQYFLTPPENLGYHIYYKVLNTKDYGIPQNRERIFIVGFREDKHSFKFPKKMPLKISLAGVLEKEVDDKYFLSDTMVKGIAKSNFKERKPLDTTGICSTLKIGGDVPCFDVKGGSMQPYPRDYKQKKVKRQLRFEARNDILANCVLTDSNSSLVKKNKRIRKLTPLECLRLQGFPDSFYDKCKEDGLSDTQLYKQAGNSMTVDVMAYLIKEILVNEKSH
ncbi:MAG: putative cytosine-specific methyltransferase [Prokaryotic dsDNA virus sp.]|nr:MAG: putative cytosine-specific methyltransferase [Prokaryotic dsDNA virus sp.]|tara:strand:- start:22790 stop:23863 length:1074 start_codon:yes stop_codon:yes gene_type:complete